MDLVPVIDLMQGKVIRGYAGQRDHYEPNSSHLVNSADPVTTCKALIRHFRPKSIYVADLDGIREQQPQWAILEALVECHVSLVVDAGTATLTQAERLLKSGIQQVIVGLETLPKIEMLKDFVSALGSDHVVFSLDLLQGEPLGPDTAGKTPLEIVAAAMEAGIHHLIVLDLAQVGTNRGVQTGTLCHTIKNRWADLVVWTGGGVRSLADLHKLSLCRVDGVMVASALHDGHISPMDWKSFQALSQDSTQLAMDA